jgi:allantoin racemase
LEFGLRILVISPSVGLSEAAIELRRKHLRGIASTETQVDVVKLKEGPASVESTLDEYYAAPEILARIVEAEKEGYDAVVDHCFGDPALHAARECVRIPVLGAGESAMMLASILGHTFSVITILRETVPVVKRLARSIGVEHKLASVRPIGIPVLKLDENSESTKKAFVEEARKAIDEDDADVICPGCTGFSVWVSEWSKELGVPVVDPAGAALKIAEALVKLNITHSMRSYPLPSVKKRTMPIQAPNPQG